MAGQLHQTSRVDEVLRVQILNYSGCRWDGDFDRCDSGSILTFSSCLSSLYTFNFLSKLEFNESEKKRISSSILEHILWATKRRRSRYPKMKIRQFFSFLHSKFILFSYLLHIFLHKTQDWNVCGMWKCVRQELKSFAVGDRRREWHDPHFSCIKMWVSRFFFQ